MNIVLAAALVSNSENIVNKFSFLKEKNNYLDQLQLYSVNCAFKEAGEAVNILMHQKKIEVVIAQGRTAQIIQDGINIPVVNIEHSYIDLIETLFSNQKKQNYKYVYIPKTFLANCDSNKIVEILGKTLNLYMNIYDYQDSEDLVSTLGKLQINKPYSIIFGGPLACKVSANMGIDSNEIYPHDKSIINTLNQAISLALIHRKQQVELEILESILGLPDKGIIVLDTKGNITNINCIASNIIGISPEKVKGKPISSFLITNQDILKMIEGKTCFNNRIVNLSTQEVILSYKILSTFHESSRSIIIIDNTARTENINQPQMHTTKLLSNGLLAKYTFNDIIGSSPQLLECKKKAIKFSQSDFNILLIGETGTGKEMFAQAMHQQSARKEFPFLAINCATLPETLLESELFGYVEGAFSGARKDGKPGMFELAHKGTIFLDEISSMTPATQAALLRVIQEKKIMRVGGNKLISVDIRMIFATNEQLINKINEGEFRDDLYFRISELILNLPPLRQRKQDIPELIRHFLTYFLSSKISQTDINKIIDSLIALINKNLSKYNWPGNIRELENLTKKIVVFYDELINSDVDLVNIVENYFINNIAIFDKYNNDTLMIPLGTIQEMEQNLIKQACKKLNMSKAEMAKELGISRSTLWRKLNEDKNLN